MVETYKSFPVTTPSKYQIRAKKIGTNHSCHYRAFQHVALQVPVMRALTMFNRDPGVLTERSIRPYTIGLDIVLHL